MCTQQLMRFYVKDIEFDFTDCEGDSGEELTVEEQYQILQDVWTMFGRLWQADDEDSLVDTITDATGFCVESIDYIQV